MVVLAAKQLGIPAQYTPQLQNLYNQFKGTGTLTDANVSAQPGISSWLNKKPALDASTLAAGLSTIFSTQ